MIQDLQQGQKCCEMDMWWNPPNKKVNPCQNAKMKTHWCFGAVVEADAELFIKNSHGSRG